MGSAHDASTPEALTVCAGAVRAAWAKGQGAPVAGRIGSQRRGKPPRCRSLRGRKAGQRCELLRLMWGQESSTSERRGAGTARVFQLHASQVRSVHCGRGHLAANKSKNGGGRGQAVRCTGVGERRRPAGCSPEEEAGEAERGEALAARVRARPHDGQGEVVQPQRRTVDLVQVPHLIRRGVKINTHGR